MGQCKRFGCPSLSPQRPLPRANTPLPGLPGSPFEAVAPLVARERAAPFLSAVRIHDYPVCGSFLCKLSFSCPTPEAVNPIYRSDGEIYFLFPPESFAILTAEKWQNRSVPCFHKLLLFPPPPPLLRNLLGRNVSVGARSRCVNRARFSPNCLKICLAALKLLAELGQLISAFPGSGVESG